MDKLNMTVSLKVEGKEGLGVELKYENTDMSTIIMVEKELLKSFLGLLEKQQKGEI